MNYSTLLITHCALFLIHYCLDICIELHIWKPEKNTHIYAPSCLFLTLIAWTKCIELHIRNQKNCLGKNALSCLVLNTFLPGDIKYFYLKMWKASHTRPPLDLRHLGTSHQPWKLPYVLRICSRRPGPHALSSLRREEPRSNRCLWSWSVPT